VLFSEPKIPQLSDPSLARLLSSTVSVLFSEPKIPQFQEAVGREYQLTRFSALQRAENSSIAAGAFVIYSLSEFQCSSASRKFLNYGWRSRFAARCRCFSALQRAENSSILDELLGALQLLGFSALQRAENSSIAVAAPYRATPRRVSVLFSEPKIPQFLTRRNDCSSRW